MVPQLPPGPCWELTVLISEQNVISLLSQTDKYSSWAASLVLRAGCLRPHRVCCCDQTWGVCCGLEGPGQGSGHTRARPDANGEFQVQSSGWNAITTGTRISGTTLWISWCSLASKFNLETLQKEAHGFPVSLSWVRVRSLRYCRTQKCHCWEFKIYPSFDFGVGYCLSRVTTDCPLDSQVSNFCIAAGWTLNCWAPREGSSRQSLP